MTVEVIVPSSPDDLKKIKSAMKEISDCMIRISAEKEAIKDIVDHVVEEYELPKKYVNKMARVYFKQSFDKETAEMSDFEQLYVAVTEVK